ncbi:undecaprenyldiphospho-muramoylpentapeptide beta-N-acetylglucosaminyltransferase [Pseudidiomarina terrestris]|uniref:UDP-N-acetylglucosamine--N-acetylmuramyl-(pentapeptide) pyrophosphoryl-undecaprenol N-acetylglucosamine transferase n=1 Tax=Pseudidiomarina terrestris TaxID=2820060 RepID=A0AAW7QZM8_9GAMM|nr:MULTISPECIES: undecaprenyldiphospho-muramoylpentapeptide beta-N-acetylglucosaminyltransferase [unclassified Pseudidiomarina]MDN7124335.1 undecaprenyldiphospho-muramoylpentapeptide beta-N-acetylglucosaminyltransferase [Pseudidiomarina sp. 1APP75-32.1]MDN7129374.1 undecaprenyldiphospho-muramoylpentapeptide beta-N-acetylglucosaminyltransferase [Pseudidiomarina sp. 1APR75-15]MDN7134361.1 undecaprenyldiphospho-muramoylpentapeptide beta-N-acetylglucosaminyltransferase [Pseudidiomarina sp. 1ASP75-5]
MSQIMIAAAGTGGHVFPALAVAEKLRERGHTVVWLGTTEQRLEARVVPAAGFQLEQISMQGLRGHGVLRKLMMPLRMLKAIGQCRKLYRQHRTQVVLSFGGYVCGPAGLAAKAAGIPLLVHEQNAVAGLTNKMLARFAQHVMVGFAAAQQQLPGAEVTGNPLRADWMGAQPQKSTDDKLRLLVVGGSLGAQALNLAVPQAVGQLSARQRLQVVHQCGQGRVAEVEQAYQQQGIAAVEVVEFIDAMHSAYAQADVVICRAGALTVSELAVVATPALFVPLPHAVDDHQTANAKELVSAGAGALLPQAQLEKIQPLVDILEDWLAHPEQLEQMRTRAQAAARPDATEVVVERCEQWL